MSPRDQKQAQGIATDEAYPVRMERGGKRKAKRGAPADEDDVFDAQFEPGGGHQLAPIGTTLDGGDLDIRWDADTDHVFMTGPVVLEGTGTSTL